MIPFIKGLADNFAALTTILAALSALVTAIIAVWYHLRRVHSVLSHIVNVPEALAAMNTRISGIEAELKTNGGSSLKDVMLRIENSQKLLRQVQVGHSDFIPRAIVMFDVSGALITANRQALDMIDAELDELAGTGWLSYVHAADDWERSTQAKSAFKRVVHINGQTQEWNIRPMRDGSQFLGWMGSITLRHD